MATVRILKAARENQRVIYKGIPIRLPTDFSAETLHDRREWHDTIRLLKGKKITNKDTLSSKIIIYNTRRVKNFSDKQKLKEFINTKPSS